MADPKPPKSAASARAERDAERKKKNLERAQRKSDQAEIKSLNEQLNDARRAKRKLQWGPERKGFEKLERDLRAKIRKKK